MSQIDKLKFNDNDNDNNAKEDNFYNAKKNNDNNNNVIPLFRLKNKLSKLVKLFIYIDDENFI